MKKTFILVIGVCFSLISQAQVSKTLTINAGQLSSALTSIEKNSITDLTITGTIDARDFKTMRDSMNVLAVLDISGATIADYSGPNGTVSYNFLIYFPANEIPECAFVNQDARIGKTSLTSVILPSSITSIRYWAFYGCTGLTSITLPSLVTSIGSAAFASCTGLSSVTLPPSVVLIGDDAFNFCLGLTSITIPLSVTSLGSGVFSSCKGLTSIIISSSVTSIGNNAFSGCYGLSSLTIPSSVISIGSQAFYACQNIISIYALGVSPIDLSSSTEVFENIDKTTCILHVPYGTSSLYAVANQWKDFTNICEIPGFTLFSVNEVIEAAQGSIASIDVSSGVTWTAFSDKTWLTVNPATGTGMKQTLTFTAEANTSTTDLRLAKITISSPDLPSQTIKVTQNITVDPTKLDTFEPDNSFDKASIITSGVIQQHSIYPFEDIDYASFELTNAPAQVEIKFNTISSDHQIQLMAADGNTVLNTDNSVINTTLTQNGKYYIKAWNHNNLLILNYQLSLNIKPIVVDRYEPDNTWEEAKLIIPFIEQDNHTIKTSGDVDYVKFTISDAPCTIYVDVTDNRKECKTFGVWLYDTNGTTLLNYSNTPKIYCGAYMEYTLTANGTYFLKVGLPQGEIGITRDDYTINLTTNGVEPSIKCNPADSLALVAIYNTMNGVNWNRKLNWLTGKVQNWQGVTLSSEGRVTKMNLTVNKLKGSIPTEIGQLTALRYLNLGNTMYAQIDNGLNDMMYSTLPLSMANLVNLEVLSLDAISFNSLLTDVFSGMAKLRELYLNQNGLTNIQLPLGILSCNKLERLSIEGNFFSQLPDVTGLTNLQSVSAQGNLFTFEDLEPNWTITGFNYSPQYRIGQSQALNPATGTSVTHTIEVGGTHNLYQWYKNDMPIPGQISNTLRVENVSKSDAGIYQLRVSNTMATQLTLYSEPLTLFQKELPVYKALEAFYNSTGGANWTNKVNWLSEAPISSWFGIDLDESGKYGLGLAFNNLIGELPANMGDLTFFTSISIYSNPQLTGSIPASIGNLDQLQNLNLLGNNLNGEIPSNFGNLKNLEQLFLASNQLSGSIPATIVNCSNLRIAVLNDNNLENLPNLTALSKLVLMYIYNNQFEFDDLMPTRLGNPNLYYYVSQKKFGKDEVYKKQPGEALTLTATVGGTGNLYQWYKDGNLLNAKTTNTLSFASFAYTDQGLYTCKVTNPGVPKLTLESKPMSILVTRAPVAKAGADQSVNELSVVTLNGTESSDPEGNSLTYKWSAQVGITLDSATTARPTFTAPEVMIDTSYTISLVVNDGIADSPADQVIITVKQVNKAPVAKAGFDQSVNELAVILLDGSVSSDPDDNSLLYKWTAPAGITLSSVTTPKPTFIAPEVTANTDYTIALVVNDGMVDSPEDQIKITVKQVNKAPVANAGSDQSVNEGATISLDGSTSTDAEGDTLTYKWIAPTEIILSSLTAAKPTFTAPEVTTDKDYTISLVVNDRLDDSPTDQVKITVKQVNKAPVSNAGFDQAINEGATVILDGSASTDADGDMPTYKWSAPAGITLSSTTAAKPTFIALEVTANTDYTISLVVNDGMIDSHEDQVKITVNQVNKAPVANAGSDQSVNEGVTVNLDGSTSTDADGDALTYKWIAPAGIILSSTTAVKPTFTAPEVTTDKDFTISLVVNDGIDGSPADLIKITVKQVNKAPVANAGFDQTVNEGATVTLDGSASTDADGDMLTYKWSVPSGITLSSTTAAKPTFIALEVTANTNYTTTLVVNDGMVDSPSDQVVINVKYILPTLHFSPDWTGNGVDHMNINMISAKLDANELEAGDEIGIFDGANCVGAGTLTGTLLQTSTLDIVVSRDDGSGNGFTSGNIISYKIFDKSKDLETSNLNTVYSNTNPSWSTDGKFSIGATAFVELTGLAKVTQNIGLSDGWNIISANVIPANLNLKDIFQPLIDAGKLQKVMDETGKTIENFGTFGGWNNNIGNLNSTKGYKVKVLDASTLSLEGASIKLSMDINLVAGWNIISFPCVSLQDAKALVQPLINAGKLKKVMDETGKTIENFGAFGGWNNSIGNFTPGKGFKVNVIENCTLTILATTTKAATLIPEVLTSNHFSKVFSGNGTDHMNIILINLPTSGLIVGDELGVFDGKYCVGSVAIGKDQMMTGSISIPASSNDALKENVNGFTAGHAVELQLYRGDKTYKLKTTILNGINSFEKNGSLFVNVTTSEIPVLQIKDESDKFRCYPNPFAGEITIDIQNSQETKITVAIYNLLGQQIKALFKGTNKGQMILRWDGTDDTGQQVEPGVYLCKVNDRTVKVVYTKGM